MSWRRALRSAARMEAGVWRGLGRWLRRRRDVPDGADAYSHHRLSAPALWLFVVMSAVEVVAVDLLLHALLPWWPLRLALVLLGVWGLVWMLGMLGAAVTSPHLITADTLRVRGGPQHDVAVPLAAVAGVRLQERDLDSSMRVLQVDEEGGELLLGVSGRTNVALTLRAPATLRTAVGPRTVRVVRLWVDEPRPFADRVGRAVAREAPPAG